MEKVWNSPVFAKIFVTSCDIANICGDIFLISFVNAINIGWCPFSATIPYAYVRLVQQDVTLRSRLVKDARYPPLFLGRFNFVHSRLQAPKPRSVTSDLPHNVSNEIPGTPGACLYSWDSRDLSTVHFNVLQTIDVCHFPCSCVLLSSTSCCGHNGECCIMYGLEGNREVCFMTNTNRQGQMCALKFVWAP